jgi:hypothetical protein
MDKLCKAFLFIHPRLVNMPAKALKGRQAQGTVAKEVFDVLFFQVPI